MGLKGQPQAGSRSAAAAGWEPEAVAALGNDENLGLSTKGHPAHYITQASPKLVIPLPQMEITDFHTYATVLVCPTHAHKTN